MVPGSRLFAFVFVFVNALTNITCAQTWGPWLQVWGTECTCASCAWGASNVPPECTYYLKCYRRDSDVTVSAGVESSQYSAPCYCEYCPQCCEDPPCSCVGLPPSHNCGQACMTVNNAVTFTLVDGCISTMPAYHMIVDSLQTAAGYSPGYCIEVCCDCLAALCHKQETIARGIYLKNVKATMRHHWAVSGYAVCPSGNSIPVHNVCQVRDSTQYYTIVLGGECIEISEWCGPVCP